MKRSLVVGSQGQDGQILFDQLARRGDNVVGIGRNLVRSHGIQPPPPVDILDAATVAALIRQLQPDEAYYLAAVHASAQDPVSSEIIDIYRRSHDVHVVGLLNLLEAVRLASPATRVFYAASSHVFGDAPDLMQNELTPLSPICVYGITKTAGIHCCRFYRRTYHLHASVGILYNHESPLRRPQFLSRKIIRAAVAIARGKQDPLVLGDLSAMVDWGYAPDYTDAMMRILSLPQPDEFVIATGQPHTVGDFVAAAFDAVALDWRKCVREDRAILSKDGRRLIGDASKLRRLTGWSPSVNFGQMIERLVRAEEAAP